MSLTIFDKIFSIKSLKVYSGGLWRKVLTKQVCVVQTLHIPQKKAYLQDWRMTSHWEMNSERLKYSAWQEHFCMPEALGCIIPAWWDTYKFHCHLWQMLVLCSWLGWGDVWSWNSWSQSHRFSIRHPIKTLNIKFRWVSLVDNTSNFTLEEIKVKKG